MSLKAFHYAFLTFSILLTLLFGLWSIRAILGGVGGAWPIVFAVGAAICLGALGRYGIWVGNKLAGESYL